MPQANKFNLDKKNEGPKKSLWEKALTKGSPQQLKRDEFLDILFWVRQLIGLAIGLIAGVFGLTGYPVFIIYIAGLYGGSQVYYSKYLEVDESDY